MLHRTLEEMLSRGVLPAAVSLGAALLDDGTDAGLVHLIQRALVSRTPSVLRVIGVARQRTSPPTRKPPSSAYNHALRSHWPCLCPLPLCAVATNTSAARNSHLPMLSSCHDGVVLTPTKKPGSQLGTLACMLTAMAHNVPGIAVLANGGPLAKTMVRDAWVCVCVCVGLVSAVRSLTCSAWCALCLCLRVCVCGRASPRLRCWSACGQRCRLWSSPAVASSPTRCVVPLVLPAHVRCPHTAAAPAGTAESRPHAM